MEDRFTARAIAPHLHTKRLGRSLLVLPSTDSTNTQVKQRFGKEPEGFVLLAEEQTAGRGRLGRSFVSPRGDGLYMSILLHPDLPLDKIPLLMLTSAVAVCEALEHQCGVWPKIKWVNDIFLRRRITVTSPAGQYPAFCVGLTDTGNLIIVDQNGTQSILRAGEISVRL